MKSLKRAFVKPKLGVPYLEVRGFFPYESRHDVISLIGSDNDGQVVISEKMDSILHANTMLPTGKWLFKFEAQQEYQRTLSQLNARSKEFQRINYRHIHEESKLFELQTTSKFGIDSKTILAYDISPSVDSEELNYALEEYGLDQKGIRKIVADKSSISFLVHFRSRHEAERALFQLNGSSFAGSNMRLHLYT